MPMNTAATLATKAMAVALGGVLTTGGLSAAAAGHTTTTIPATLYTPTALGAQATYAVSNIYANAPVGTVTLGGVPFTVANTAWAGSGQTYTVPANTPKPTSVHLLLDSSNATLAYKGQNVGRIHLTFSDGKTQDTNLIAGANVREWWSASTLVDTLTDANASTVWTGQAQPAMGVTGPARIDKLMVSIPATSANLTQISIINVANAPFYVFSSGVTVGYQAPVATGGGNNNDETGNNNNDQKDTEKVNKPTPKKPVVEVKKPAAKAEKTVTPIVNTKKAAQDEVKHDETSQHSDGGHQRD